MLIRVTVVIFQVLSKTSSVNEIHQHITSLHQQILFRNSMTTQSDKIIKCLCVNSKILLCIFCQFRMQFLSQCLLTPYIGCKRQQSVLNYYVSTMNFWCLRNNAFYWTYKYNSSQILYIPAEKKTLILCATQE